MEKVRPWCGQPSDRGQLKNKTEQHWPIPDTETVGTGRQDGRVVRAEAHRARLSSVSGHQQLWRDYNLGFMITNVQRTRLYAVVLQQCHDLWTHTHTCLTALCPGLPKSAGTRKVKPIWILLKQETVSGSGIRLGHMQVCTSRQITTSAPHHSVVYRPDALPAAQPTASKHWRPRSTDRQI